MFRNIYIEAYKNSIQQNNSLEMMLIHVNHIHSVMGCVIQDIEFMVGNALGMIKKIDNEDRQALKKREGKERFGVCEQISDMEFKAPKIEYLPSSSIKHDYQTHFQHEPEKARGSNNYNIKRNDSFEAMFPNLKESRGSEGSNGSNLQPNNYCETNKMSNEEDEDFMEFLFKKKKK